jgi:chloride channel protein, CIC family
MIRKLLKKYNLLKPSGNLAIAEASIIGLVAGLSAVLLKFGVNWLGTLRVNLSYHFHPLLLLPILGFCLGFLAGFIVEKFGKEAAGSGIPQVKAALAQFPIALDFRVALVKLSSCILALGSGITLGRQGPTVQIGSAVAAQLSSYFPTSFDQRRQIIAAGAGAGLAAAFNAPIAGVLFVVEELLHDVSGLTLGTAIVASFIGAVVSRVLGGGSLDVQLQSHSTSLSLTEIPFYLLLGISCGLLSALFSKGIFISLKFYRQFLPISLPLRIGLAGSLSGFVMALLPQIFRDNTGLREFIIKENAPWEIALMAFLAQFFLTLIAIGSTAPGGLFAPSLIMGSSLGYLIGLLPNHLLGLGEPTTYALTGMGAFFSGISKVPITAIVIIFEMTTDFNLVLPLMIGSVSAYLVSEGLFPRSIYDKLLEFNGIKLKTEVATKEILSKLTAADLMQRKVETLSSSITIDQSIGAFSRSHHRGFPVVNDGDLVGIITQSDLDKCDLSGDEPIAKIMTENPITVTPIAPLTEVLYLLNRYQLSRLPVTDGKVLVGIITRSDLIRAEAEHLNKNTEIGRSFTPSYLVYQTRSPHTGKGKLLVPLANPQTAPILLQFATAIALYRQYELVCLQVMIIPPHQSPSETNVRTAKSRKLLKQAERFGTKHDLSVHTQIRVGHDIAQTILETIKDENIDFTLMGWNIEKVRKDLIFGNVVDRIIKEAICEVILIKIGNEYLENSINSSFCLLPSAFRNWLLPIAGGNNSKEAMELLPALLTLGDKTHVEICQVFPDDHSDRDTSFLKDSATILTEKIAHNVTFIPIYDNSIPSAIIDLTNAHQTDVLILGASKEGLLKQVINGNIPEAIARGVNSTVILVRI